MENILNSKEYKRSRAFYIVQCAVFYFITLLVSDAFLARLLSYMGISDSLVGIISTFISLAMISQLSSLFLLRTKVSRKNTVIVLNTISAFLFALVYLAPFLPINESFKNIIVTGGLLLAYMLQHAATPVYFKWANAYVDSGKRGEFSALKEIVSLIGGIVFTLIAGYVVDLYEGLGKIESAFIFIISSILVLNIINFVSMLFIKKESSMSESSKGLKEVIKYLVENKSFRNVVIMNTIFYAGNYFTFGFIGIFKLSELGISLFVIQVINFIAQFIRAAISKPFGRYTDKTSYAKGMRLALSIMLISYVVIIFTFKSTWYLIILHTVLYNIALAGTEQNANNIMYSYVKNDYLSEAVAIKNCIVGVMGFLASLVAGFMVEKGMGIQSLAVISCVMILIAIIYLIKVIEKQKKIED